MRLLATVCLVLTFCSSLLAEDKPQVWLYCPTNLGVPENVTKLQELWTRAQKVGYTHVLLADSKFAKLQDLPKSYFANCLKTKQLAADLKLEIVPALFSVGYSNDMLWNDPNMAEGLPVKDALFVVKDGQATLVEDPPVKLGKMGYHDENVHLQDGEARVEGSGEHSRFIYTIDVTPYRCYHVSAMIKSEGYTGDPKINVLGADERGLNWKNLGVKHTQDWTRHDIVFNSLDNKQVHVYFGVWGQAKGKLWWKDWKIEEAGLVNVLRRDGTPCTVKGEDGKLYQEGTDYERVVDPHLGNDPWSGQYTVWHTPPVIHTKLPDGTRLRVSWYHPSIIYDEQVCACISEPKVIGLLADQAKRMKELWGAPAYMMSHDEFRVFNFDESCQKKQKTPGELLAENIKYCRKLLQPQGAYVWNDMFDPYHNAVKGPYYLVNGPWTGSWEGLDKDTVIMNWNFGKRDESLKFFADRGHQQIIAGYYDAPLTDFQQWLDSAAKVKGVIGYMYTTWSNNYDHIEEFAKMAKAAKHSGS